MKKLLALFLLLPNLCFAQQIQPPSCYINVSSIICGNNSITPTIGGPYLPLSGGTLTGPVTSSSSLTLGGASIGSDALAVTGTATFSNVVNGLDFKATRDLYTGASNGLQFTGRSIIQSPSNGIIEFSNNAVNDFSRLQLGGTSASFPAIKRNGAAIDIRLADDSAAAALNAGTIAVAGCTIGSNALCAAGNFEIASGSAYKFASRSTFASGADGNIVLQNNAGSSFGLLQLGGITSSFPAIKRNAAALNFRLADDSGDAGITAFTGVFSSDLTIGAGGTKATIFANTGQVNSLQAIIAYSNTAPPAGGNLGFLFSNVANFGVMFGTGAPTLSAAKGSLYLRRDGTTTNDRIYVNTDGGTTWTAIITAS